jgi:hypothetical protein
MTGRLRFSISDLKNVHLVATLNAQGAAAELAVGKPLSRISMPFLAAGRADLAGGNPTDLQPTLGMGGVGDQSIPGVS